MAVRAFEFPVNFVSVHFSKMKSGAEGFFTFPSLTSATDVCIYVLRKSGFVKKLFLGYFRLHYKDFSPFGQFNFLLITAYSTGDLTLSS